VVGLGAVPVRAYQIKKKNGKNKERRAKSEAVNDEGTATGGGSRVLTFSWDADSQGGLGDEMMSKYTYITPLTLVCGLSVFADGIRSNADSAISST